MKFIEILPSLRKLIIFSVRDIELLDRKYTSSKVTNWVKKGYLIPIKRGYYTLGEFIEKDELKYLIANRIYSPSYISLETVLAKNNIIPEYPFTLTSVSTKKTQRFSTIFGDYSYNSLKSNLFWGYRIEKTDKYTLLEAELEKAIIDFFILRPQYKVQEDFEGLRWNKQELRNKLDSEKIQKYSDIIANKTLSKKINTLIEYIHDDWAQLY